MADEFYPERDNTLVDELRRGFENLGRDIRGALSATNAGVERLSGDIRYGAGLAQGAGRTFAGGAGGRAFNFMRETFSKEFNRPALWSRDIMYMLGKDPRDMTKGQAQYYAREHWNQRFRQFGSFAAKDVAPIAMLAGGWAGAAGSLGYEVFVSPHIVDQKALYKWKNYLDRSSQSYVLSGASENRVTGRGWSEQQLESISRFHLQYEKSNRYFKKDEQFAIEQLATSQGYYQKTTSMAQYKRKYKELIEGTREVMKTLHTSMEEAVGVMSEISRLKVTDQKGFIKGVGLAAAYSGLSSQQVMKYAGAFGAGMDKRGFTPGYGAQVGIELLKQPARDFTAYSIDRVTKSNMMMAAFYTPEGKWDAGFYKSFMAGKGTFQEALSRGAQNVAGYQATGTWGAFKRNREGIMSENILAAEMVNFGPMFEYRAFQFKTQGTGWSPRERMDYFLSDLKDRGVSEEKLKEIEKRLWAPLVGRQWSEFGGPAISGIQGRGNIFQQVWKYNKAGWEATGGKLGRSWGRMVNQWGLGIFREGYREIEEKGKLSERYLIARRIVENFQTEGGAGYKEVGKWLGADFSSEAFDRFRLKEIEADTGIVWDKKAWMGEVVRQKFDKYNRLIGYVTGKAVKKGYDMRKAHGIGSDMERALGDYVFRPGDIGWFKTLEPFADKYGETAEYQAAIQNLIRKRMGGGEKYLTLGKWAYSVEGTTSTGRKWMEGAEREVWLGLRGEFEGGVDKPADIGKLVNIIQKLPAFGRYREGKHTDEEFIQLAEASIKKTNLSMKLQPDTAGLFLQRLTEEYEGPLIEKIRKKPGKIEEGDLTDIEAIMAGILGSQGGAISVEVLQSVADGMYVLKKSIDAMHDRIKKETPSTAGEDK